MKVSITIAIFMIFLTLQQCFAVDSCIYGKIITDNQNTSNTYWFYDTTRSSDQSYRQYICNQTVISRYWSAFGMEKTYWDDGMGYYDVCNVTQPLARTLNSIWVLENSKNNAFGSNMLNNAYSFAADRTNHLRAKCGDGSANANHEGAGLFDWMAGYNGNGTTNIFWPAIYGLNVVARAGTILHEARHRDKGHDAEKDCPDKGSCDSSWGFNGANTYKALYLWWYGYYASNTTSTLKTMALDDAQYVIDHRFKTNPNLRVR